MYFQSFSSSKDNKKKDEKTVIRGESLLKGGTLNSRSSLSSCTRQIIPALVCTCHKYMLQSSQSSIYHDRGTLHGCMSCMCDKEPFACHLKCSHGVFPGHTQQWKKADNGRLYAVHVQPLMEGNKANHQELYPWLQQVYIW